MAAQRRSVKIWQWVLSWAKVRSWSKVHWTVLRQKGTIDPYYVLRGLPLLLRKPRISLCLSVPAAKTARRSGRVSSFLKMCPRSFICCLRTTAPKLVVPALRNTSRFEILLIYAALTLKIRCTHLAWIYSRCLKSIAERPTRWRPQLPADRTRA